MDVITFEKRVHQICFNLVRGRTTKECIKWDVTTLTALILTGNSEYALPFTGFIILFQLLYISSFDVSTSCLVHVITCFRDKYTLNSLTFGNRWGPLEYELRHGYNYGYTPLYYLRFTYIILRHCRYKYIWFISGMCYINCCDNRYAFLLFSFLLLLLLVLLVLEEKDYYFTKKWERSGYS